MSQNVDAIVNAANRKLAPGGGFEYWWCGTRYPDLDTIYNALAKQKRFMELTITTED